jgi:hypothetical protein
MIFVRKVAPAIVAGPCRFVIVPAAQGTLVDEDGENEPGHQAREVMR